MVVNVTNTQFLCVMYFRKSKNVRLRRLNIRIGLQMRHNTDEVHENIHGRERLKIYTLRSSFS